MGASEIRTPSARVEKVRGPGKYSRKGKQIEKSKGTSEQETSDKKFTCFDCGRDKCNRKYSPAKKFPCNKCGQKGHFEASDKCPKKKKNNEAKANYHEASDSSSSSEEYDQEMSESSEFSSPEPRKTVNCLKKRNNRKVFKVGGSRKVSRARRRKRGYKVEVKVNEVSVEVNADTGAEIDILPSRLAKELDLTVKKCKMKIHPYGAKPFPVIGKVVADTSFGQEKIETTWYVVKKKVEPLLSGTTAEALGIITFHDTPPAEEAQVNAVETQQSKNEKYMSKHPNVFKGIGVHNSYIFIRNRQSNQ